MVLAGHLGQLLRGDPPEPKSPKSRQKSIFCESGTFSLGESPFRHRRMPLLISAPPACVHLLLGKSQAKDHAEDSIIRYRRN